MFKAVVGHSDDIDAEDAARIALDACARQLGGVAPNAAIVFVGSMMDAQPALDAIAARFPAAEVVGATSMAELSSSMAHAESSLAVMMLASDTVEMAAGIGEGAAADPRGAAARAVEMAKKKMRSAPRLCVCTCNGMQVNPSHVFDGLVAALGSGVAVVGGSSSCELSPDMRMQELFGTRTAEQSIVVLLFGGAVRFAQGMDRGWTPVGSKHVITRAHDNVIVEIDGMPALALYQQYLGTAGHPNALFVHHPLAVQEPGRADIYLRAGFAAGPEPGSLVVAGNVAEGATVQLTEYQRENIVAAAASATRTAKRAWGEGEPGAALVFTCSTRKTVLGTWTVREIEALRAELPHTAFLGFYAFGELAEPEVGQPPRVQNGSFVTLLLGEAP